MEDLWDSSIPREGGWSLSFSRPLNDWEVGSAKRFLSSLEGMGCTRTRKIGCFGQRLRMASILRNHSIWLWR